MSKMIITIEVEGGNPVAKITVGDQIYLVDGLAIFGESKTPGNLFSFFWASPLMAARAVVISLAESIRRGDDFSTQFYRDLLGMLVHVTGVNREEVDPEEILKRWEQEDKNKTTHH